LGGGRAKGQEGAGARASGLSGGAQPPIGSQMPPRGTGPGPTPEPPRAHPPDPQGTRKMY
jgi:hypothetical protein